MNEFDTVNERITTADDGPHTVNERLTEGGEGPEGQADTVTERLSGGGDFPATQDEIIAASEKPEVDVNDEPAKPRKSAKR